MSDFVPPTPLIFLVPNTNATMTNKTTNSFIPNPIIFSARNNATVISVY